MRFLARLAAFISAVAIVGGAIAALLTWGGDVLRGVGEVGNSLGFVDSDSDVQVQAASFELGQTIAAMSLPLNAYIGTMPDGLEPPEQLPDNLKSDSKFVAMYSVIFDEYTQNRSTMLALSSELGLTASVEEASLDPIMYPLEIQSAGSRLISNEIRRRHGERPEEAFLLGLQIREAIYQARDDYFGYGEFSIDGISGTTVFGSLADRARSFGVDAKTGSELQTEIDDEISRWEKIVPDDVMAQNATKEAIDITNSTVRLELQSLEFELAREISQRRQGAFVRNALIGIIIASLALGGIVFAFRQRVMT